MIAMKYGEEWGGWISVRETHQHGCRLWRIISAGWDNFFFQNVYFELGDNIQVRFWHDIWGGNHSLKELSPSFYACAVDKNPTIHLVMDSQLDRESRTQT